MALAPSTNSAVPAQSPRSFGSTEAQDTSPLPREASSMARLARTKAARNSSVSPGPRVAAADPDFLARRRRRDVQPRAARELDHRAGIGIVHPPRAAIERHLECRHIGQAAAADLAGGLHHDDLAVRCLDAPRRGDAGRTRSDHDNVSLARQRRAPCVDAEHRRHRKACCRREKAAARHCHVMVSEALKKTGTLSELAASRRARQPSW